MKSTIAVDRTAAFLAGALLVLTAPGSILAAEDDSKVVKPGQIDAKASILGEEDKTRQPRVEGGRIILPPLMAPNIATDKIGNGRTPDGFRESDEQPLQTLPESPADRGESWNWTVGHWAAANTFSYPRYFEDRMLERHGQERKPCLQPFASGARFFATIPMLPYLMVVRDPCDCESTLGYYRSGSCAPIMLQRPPYERRAAIAEAAAIAGTIIAFP